MSNAESSPPVSRIRRTALFSGRVQGVGFRYKSEELAARFNVAGYVRNLDDGRVELVAEGTAQTVNDFLHAIATRMRDHIERVESYDGPFTGEFDEFRIRF